MANIRLKHLNKPVTHSCAGQDYTISYDKDCDMPANLAIGYIGVENYTVTFTPKDKQTVEEAPDSLIDVLKKEFKIEGSKEDLIKKMFPLKQKKKIIKKEIKPKKAEVVKPKPKVDKEVLSTTE
jgi:uncharacterized protein with NRDE domain